jgi:protein SCO1/2
MSERPFFRQPWVWVTAAVLAAGAVGIGLWARQALRPRHGTSDERPLEGMQRFGAVPDFSFTERSGREVRLADLLEKVWVLDFIYTNCPDTCPIQTAQMKSLQDEFAAEKDLQLISITVDPTRDTPAALSEYAARFKADAQRWLFLTGDKDAIYKLAQEGFHLAVAELPQQSNREPSAATHAHSPRFVLIDRKAEIRGYYQAIDKQAVARLRRDLRRLLQSAE